MFKLENQKNTSPLIVPKSSDHKSIMLLFFHRIHGTVKHLPTFILKNQSFMDCLLNIPPKKNMDPDPWVCFGTWFYTPKI